MFHSILIIWLSFKTGTGLVKKLLGITVVYFDQLCMVENNDKHSKIMKKESLLSCEREAQVRRMNENEETSLLVSNWE